MRGKSVNLTSLPYPLRMLLLLHPDDYRRNPAHLDNSIEILPAAQLSQLHQLTCDGPDLAGKFLATLKAERHTLSLAVFQQLLNGISGLDGKNICQNGSRGTKTGQQNHHYQLCAHKFSSSQFLRELLNSAISSSSRNVRWAIASISAMMPLDLAALASINSPVSSTNATTAPAASPSARAVSLSFLMLSLSLCRPW